MLGVSVSGELLISPHQHTRQHMPAPPPPPHRANRLGSGRGGGCSSGRTRVRTPPTLPSAPDRAPRPGGSCEGGGVAFR